MPRPCSICHRPSRDGLASVYWAWFPAPNERVGYRTKICADCTSDHVVPMMASSPLERAVEIDFNCTLCGAGVEHDAEYIYGTVYMPGHESSSFEAQVCPGCMAKTAELIAGNGYRLPNRDPATRARARDDSVWNLLAG